MIFLRTLLREFANLAVAVFLSLFLIALTTRLIRLLGQAAGGKIPSDAVVAFLGFSALNLLPVLLSLTLFITVLLALNRSWRDVRRRATDGVRPGPGGCGRLGRPDGGAV